MSKRIREVPVSKLKEELDSKNKELEKLTKSINKEILKLEDKIYNTIECPNCKKYFKEVWVRKVYIAHTFFRGGYFGDEKYESMSRYYTLECPKCKYTWNRFIENLGSVSASSLADDYDERERSYDYTHTVNRKGDLIG